MQTKFKLTLLSAASLLIPCLAQANQAVDDKIKAIIKNNNVTGASICYFNKGKVVYSKSFGKTAVNNKINENTLFQAASISKSVTGFGLLRVAQEGKWDLDKNVNSYLDGWEFSDHHTITSRMLLSHTAGTNVHGFAGYSQTRPIPTIEQVLDGKAAGPANSDKVKVVAKPLMRHLYSGGGYCVLQKAMQDASGKSFEEIMKKNVFKPLGLKNATFDQSIKNKTSYAAGHENLKMVIGGYHIYPEQAAAGLWISSKDLSKLLIAVQSSSAGGDQFLTKKSIHELFTSNNSANYALGVYSNESSFSHGGTNQGYRSFFKVSKKPNGQGFVILTNCSNGNKIYNDVEKVLKTSF